MNGLETQLRGVHLPSIPSWWPLSSFGYFVILALSIIFALLGYYLVSKWLKGRAKRKALKQISIYKNMPQENNAKTIAHLSILLRRVALAYYPRHEVAGLTGDEWLKFLNQTNGSETFTKEVGQLLLSAPYQKDYPDNFDELLNLIESWVKKRK